jgi:TetR/AcrR family transcriptional repressor of nem operon
MEPASPDMISPQMSRIPNTRKEDTHERIVQVASRAIRKHGYAGVGVASVMQEAGLTHGGFYLHFESRNALLIEALDRAVSDGFKEAIKPSKGRDGTTNSGFRGLVEEYLADKHLASLDTGCPVSALASDMPRQEQVVRDASALRVKQLIAATRQALPQSHRAAASVVTATLVGSLQLARAIGNNSEGRAVLKSSRETLLRLYDF